MKELVNYHGGMEVGQTIILSDGLTYRVKNVRNYTNFEVTPTMRTWLILKWKRCMARWK